MGHSVEWEPRGAIIRFSDVVAIQDIAEAVTHIESDPRFDGAAFIIGDYRRIVACVAVPQEMEKIWIQDFGALQTNPRVRKAIVTTSAEVVALATYYRDELGDAMPVGIFETMEGARDWLDAGEARP